MIEKGLRSERLRNAETSRVAGSGGVEAWMRQIASVGVERRTDAPNWHATYEKAMRRFLERSRLEQTLRGQTARQRALLGWVQGLIGQAAEEAVRRVGMGALPPWVSLEEAAPSKKAPGLLAREYKKQLQPKSKRHTRHQVRMLHLHVVSRVRFY